MKIKRSASNSGTVSPKVENRKSAYKLLLLAVGHRHVGGGDLVSCCWPHQLADSSGRRGEVVELRLLFLDRLLLCADEGVSDGALLAFT